MHVSYAAGTSEGTAKIKLKEKGKGRMTETLTKMAESEKKRQKLSELARKLSQKEWDKLYPPGDYGMLEPGDASGYDGSLEIIVIA